MTLSRDLFYDGTFVERGYSLTQWSKAREREDGKALSMMEKWACQGWTCTCENDVCIREAFPFSKASIRSLALLTGMVVGRCGADTFDGSSSHMRFGR